jgi:hypothetical protein
MGARATNLAKTALQQISPLREWIKSAKLKIESSKNSGREDHTYLKRKLNILDYHLRAYDALHNNFSSPTSDDAKLQYLRDDRLGFFAFTSAILADQERDGFVEELEIDYRLSPTVVLQMISIFVGEIKSGSGAGTYDLALYQVVRRLGVLYMVALYSLLGDYAPYYSFAGVGEIFSPNNSWMNRDSSNKIEDIKKFAGIVAYPLPGLLIIIVKVIA